MPKHAAVVQETPDEAEWKALKNEADRLLKKTQKEEHDFNEFQQQREKLNYFWIVEKKKLEDARANLRNKDRELQDLEEKHQVEIKIYKQRLKHLLSEHQHEVTQKRIESEMAIKMAQDDNREEQRDMKGDKRVQTLAVRELEFNHEEYIRSLKKEQDQKITFLRHEFERNANETQKTYDSKMKKTREALDARRKDEIKRIEESKHIMIDQLLAEHQKAFADIKNYYNDITHNNLDLIKSLKEEVKELENEEKKDEMRLNEKMIENKRLSAPLKKMEDDVIKLRAELEDYNKEKEEMRRVKAALQVVEAQSSTSSWEHETLKQRFADLKKERDDLRNNLMASLYEVKQKSGFRGLLLEKKLSAVRRVQEEREAQLTEVLSRANLEPQVLGNVRGKVDDVLGRKNAEARGLQTEVARLQALHDQLQTAVKEKLKQYGLGLAELGFEPASVEKLSSMPILSFPKISGK
jgi:growth arrest-specific protein 8